VSRLKFRRSPRAHGALSVAADRRCRSSRRAEEVRRPGQETSPGLAQVAVAALCRGRCEAGADTAGNCGGHQLLRTGGLDPHKGTPFTRHPPLDLLADSCVAGSFGPREGLSLGGGAPLMTSPSVGSALARCGHWHPQPHTRRPSRLGLRIDDLYHTAGYARDEQPAVSARCAPTDFTHTRRPASVREMPSGPACRCANAHARGDPMCATCSAGSPVRYRRGWGRASGW
jgi:hypothetical protein